MYGDNFKKATISLMTHCREQLGYDKDPDIHYVTDKDNANNMLGYTAHYQPEKKIVTVYISNRHPKDALRSLAHELVHHAQNERGDLNNVVTQQGYAQSDPHMRKMEEEAYLKGNMMFRDWEDHCKSQKSIKLTIPATIGEQKMTELKDLIKEKILNILNEKSDIGKRSVEAGADDKPEETKMDHLPDEVLKNIAAKKGKKKDKKDDKEKVEERSLHAQAVEDGEKGEKDRRRHINTQQEYIDGYSEGVRRRKEKEEKKVDEGGAAQRHDNLDRLRRQDVDRLHEEDEETLEEGNCPACEGRAPKSECKCGTMKESELTAIKKNQDSITSLNENRLLNINKELMRRLIK